MEIIYSCPQCGTKYSITDDLFDTSLQCSICQNIFIVSREQAEKEKADTLQTSTLPQKSFSFRKYKKWVISSFVIVFSAVIFLFILPLIIHSNFRKMPRPLQQYGTVFGTSWQRASACWNLACNDKSEQKPVYLEKCLAILENCEENANVLHLKLLCKFRGDNVGMWTSPDAKRLIQLDKKYIGSYVLFQQDRRRKNNIFPVATQEESALLKEYEQYLLKKIKTEGLKYPVDAELGSLYSGSFGNAADYDKAEYYLKEAVKNSPYWYQTLIILYARQNKTDDAEKLASELIQKSSDKQLNVSIAMLIFEIYTSTLEYRGNKLNLPLNYEKAIKWKNLVLEYNPDQERFLNDILKASFPEKQGSVPHVGW